jgi:nitroreductase
LRSRGFIVTQYGGSPMAEPITLVDALATTRAIRRYTDDPIPDADLNQMMWLATRAPSGSNRQGFRFVVLRDGVNAARARALIGEGARQVWGNKRVNDRYDSGSGAVDDSPKARTARTMDHFVEHMHEAPVIVLACVKIHRPQMLGVGGSVWPAVQNLLLAARALGYGGVITGFHGPREAELRELLHLPPPESVAIAATIPLGRPQGRHGPVRRRPMPELVYDDSWEGAATWASDPPGTKFTQAGPPKA